MTDIEERMGMDLTGPMWESLVWADQAFYRTISQARSLWFSKKHAHLPDGIRMEASYASTANVAKDALWSAIAEAVGLDKEEHAENITVHVETPPDDTAALIVIYNPPHGATQRVLAYLPFDADGVGDVRIEATLNAWLHAGKRAVEATWIQIQDELGRAASQVARPAP